MDIFRLIKLWLEGELKGEALNKKKNELFESEEELKQYENIIEHSGNLKVPAGRPKSEIWDDLQKKIENDTKKSRKLFIKQPIFYYSIASTIVVFFSVLFFLDYDSTTEVIVNAAQKEIIFLPDSSEVIVNSASKLSFSAGKWEKERLVNLDGEAFFKVKKGSRFTVDCANGQIAVKGTIFNVFSRGNTLEVKCTEGVVSVTSKSGKTKLLKENQGVNFGSDNNDGEIFSISDSNTDLWTKGQFYFDNENLEKVFSEIERQFDIKIQIDGENGRFFNGYFNNKDLEQALKMVCMPMGLTYEIENDSLVIVKANTESLNP